MDLAATLDVHVFVEIRHNPEMVYFLMEKRIHPITHFVLLKLSYSMEGIRDYLRDLITTEEVLHNATKEG